MKKQILVKGVNVKVLEIAQKDYICISDIAKTKEGRFSDQVIHNWMRNKHTIDFLGIWEKIHNQDFNPLEFEGFRKKAGSNSFVLSPTLWIDKTNSIGIIVKRGKFGGVYAHKYIALAFASWISPEFELYLVSEFDRLKFEENNVNNNSLNWDIKRTLTKINYQIHTFAIKENLIPPELTQIQINQIYASEADILNIVLFGKTAKQWKEKNKEKDGNIRDYCNVCQLVCLSNLENLNSVFINEGLNQSDRLLKLNKIAISQMKILVENTDLKKLKNN